MRRLLVFTLITLALAISVVPTYSQTPTHYMLGRPIPRIGIVQPARGYPYGWTRNGESSIHHGVDIENQPGTWVIAAADGTIYFAGGDHDRVFGPGPDFYGNTVIIQHDFAAPEGGTVYTLYGHLAKITVQVGQRVKKGQQIGTVGKTGIALGYHLHFEVRVGNPDDYNAVRNPELWYAPQPRTGKIVGRMVDANGGLAMGIRFVITTTTSVYPSWTYADPSIPHDPAFSENFVVGDLPVGCYRFRVRNNKGGYAYDNSFCLRAGETKIMQVQLKN
jgi:murein DD-endopeptidase MepM/ murein hydrolase activator NlpD